MLPYWNKLLEGGNTDREKRASKSRNNCRETKVVLRRNVDFAGEVVWTVTAKLKFCGTDYTTVLISDMIWDRHEIRLCLMWQPDLWSNRHIAHG